jgi:hypothetical protein
MPDENKLSVIEEDSEKAIDLLLSSDITRLTQVERAKYCYFMAKRNGLDPSTRPFDIISAGGRTFVYANRSASDQLRKINQISLEVTERGMLNLGGKDDLGVYYVRCVATTPDGRRDEAVGAVNVIGQKGEALANSIMKCETKAKRRATLSIAGLGMPDETEISGIGGPSEEVVKRPLGPKLLVPTIETSDYPPTTVPE